MCFSAWDNPAQEYHDSAALYSGDQAANEDRQEDRAAIGTAGPPLEGWEDEAADSGYGDW